MTFVNRRAFFGLLGLLIFSNTVTLLWRAQYQGRQGDAFSNISINKVSSLTKRSQPTSNFENKIGGNNSFEFHSFASDSPQFECENIYAYKDKCSFVRKHCQTYSTGLFNYLEFYFCGLKTLKFPKLAILFTWLLFLFGFIGVAASDFFCPNLSTLASKLNLSESMAGVTFLAFGNGSPDVFSTFSAMSNYTGSLAIGELIGAAAFISSVVAGSMAVISPFRVTRVPFLRDVIFFIGAIAFVLFIIWDGRIYFWESIILVLYYITYVSVVVIGTWWAKRNKRKQKDNIVEEDLPEITANEEDFDAYGYDTYSETDLLLPEGQRNEEYAAINPITLTALSTYNENTEDFHSPASHISMSDVMDQALYHYHPHNVTSRHTTRPLHRGMRPSLFAAIEFHDAVRSLKLDRDLYNRPSILRSQTMPGVASDHHRERSCATDGGVVERINHIFGAEENPILARRYSTPNPSSSVHAPTLFSQDTDSNLKDNNLKLPDSNLKGTNLKPPRPIVPHLLLTPATPLSDRSPLLSPKDLTISPQAMSPQQTSDSTLPEIFIGSPSLYTPPLSPAPMTPLIHPSLTIWKKMQLALFPSLTEFNQKSTFAKLVALVVCPAIFMLTLTLPVVEEDFRPPIEEKKQQNTSVAQSHHIDPPTIMIDDHDLALEDQPEINDKVQGWNRCLTSFQCLLSPVFVVTVITGGQESPEMILYAFFIGVLLSFSCYCLTNDEQPPQFYADLCYVGFAVAMLWIYLVANEVVGLLQALGLIMGLSDAILGLTIFAMGNSLGDFVANITIAKMGFPMMAMSACFGGPMLNILLGIGIGGMYMTLKTHEPYPITVSPTLFVSSLGLLITLFSSLVYIPQNDYHMTKGWGHYLIVVYITCMAVNVSLEIMSGRS